MSSDSSPFLRQLREAMAASAAERAERDRNQLALGAESLRLSRLSEQAKPLVAQRIRSDAFAFAGLMKERGHRPSRQILRVSTEVGQAAIRQLGQTPAAQPSKNGYTRRVWTIGWDGRGSLDASAPSHGAYFYTYVGSIVGVAMDVQGFLWRFTQEQRRELGYSDSSPNSGKPNYLDPYVDAVRLATDEDLLEGDNWGTSRYISKNIVQPVVSDAPEDQPVVRDFQNILIAIAAAAG